MRHDRGCLDLITRAAAPGAALGAAPGAARALDQLSLGTAVSRIPSALPLPPSFDFGLSSLNLRSYS